MSVTDFSARREYTEFSNTGKAISPGKQILAGKTA